MITPRVKIRVGRERLQGSRSRVDGALLSAVEWRESQVHAVIFRANASGDASWRFDDSLSSAEAAMLGYRIVSEELQVYRKLAARGVVVLAGVEFGLEEIAAYRAGIDRLTQELERATTSDSAEDRAFDLWLCRNLPLCSSVSCDTFINNTLVPTLPMIEARFARAAELAGVPVGVQERVSGAIRFGEY